MNMIRRLSLMGLIMVFISVLLTGLVNAPIPGCDPDNQVCTTACNDIGQNYLGTNWDYDEDAPDAVFCYDNLDIMHIFDNEMCDIVIGFYGMSIPGTGDCADYWDTITDDDYVCPGADRKGGPVSASDCECYDDGGGCGLNYEDLFDFSNEFFAGPITDCWDPGPSPHPICTCTDLQNINTQLGWDYELQNNIDCSGTIGWNTGAGFDPLGALSGTLDGNGYFITGLFIYRPGENYVGLFGAIDTGTEIMDVGLVDINITGLRYVGGIAGRRNGGNITRVYSTGNITGGDDYVGGLVGYFSTPPANLTNVYSIANVSGNQRAGGLIGYFHSSHHLNNSYFAGYVSATVTGALSPFCGSSSNSFFDTETSGQTNGCGTGKTTAEMKDITTFTDTSTAGLDTPWDFVGNPNHDTGNADIWDIDGVTNDGYPFLAFAGPGPDVTPPSVSFVTPPTPLDDSIQSEEWAVVGVSASDTESDVSTFIDFDRSLVGWWRMDDVNQTTPGALVYDRSSYGNNGTAVADAVQTDAGYLGKAFEFDGDGDCIDLGQPASLNFSGRPEITVSGWVNTTDSYNYLGIVSTGRGSTNTIRFSFDVYGTRALIVFWGNGTDYSHFVSDNDDLLRDFNKWYHVAVSINSTHLTFYINGTQSGLPHTLDRDLAAPFSNWEIGRAFYNEPDSFSGSIDDVMIFNRSLSTEEIQALYANTSNKYLEHNFTGLSLGSHTFRAYAQDTAGNVGQTGEWNFTVVTEVPSCQSQGYVCCAECSSGTDQPAYDGDCPAQVCCGGCAVVTPPPSFYFQGIIDQVMVYNRALTPEEIRSHYEYPYQFMFHPMEVLLTMGYVY